MGPTWERGINPDLETLCFYFGSIFRKENKIEWETLTELVVPLLVAKIRNLRSQRDKRRKALSLLVGIDSIFTAVARVVLLSKLFCSLGHTTFSWAVPSISREAQTGLFIFSSAVLAPKQHLSSRYFALAVCR